MFVDFKNNSTDSNMNVFVNNLTYVIEPGGVVSVPYFSDDMVFTAETKAVDLLEGFDDDFKSYSLKEKLLYKATVKFAEKLPELALYTKVTYKLKGISQDIKIDLFDSVYAVGDGFIADFFDFLPLIYCFAQAETLDGDLKIESVHTTNKKEYLKLYRKIMLFSDWGLILPDLFFFIPKYILAKVFTANFYITFLLSKLYRLSSGERFKKIEEKTETKAEKHGCLYSILQGLLLLVILIALVLWASSSE